MKKLIDNSAETDGQLTILIQHMYYKAGNKIHQKDLSRSVEKKFISFEE